MSPIESIGALFTAIAAESMHPEPDAIGELCHLVNPKALLEDVGRRLAADPGFANQTRRLSREHPNGFARIVLAAPPLERHVRIHVFPGNGPDVGIADIHDHRWHFASKVIAGGIRIREFAVSEHSGIPFYAYKHLPHEPSRGFSLQPLGVKRLCVHRSWTCRAGETYSGRAETPHQVLAMPTVMSATLVIEGDARARATSVFSSQPRPQQVLGRDSYAPVDPAELIEDILGLMSC